MSEFSQNGVVATLHDFSNRDLKDLERDLKKFSKDRKMELILPCLYSELEGSALPNIVSEISKTNYLNHIIIGLDRANEEQAKKAWNFFKKLNCPFTILWNDGPNLLKLDKELKNYNLAPQELGKGRNVWYCLGMAIARGEARSIAFHDCDILTFDRRLLAKLFYPVVNPLFNFEFCKGYYPRVAEGKMNGRVSRLLVTPLLTAMEKTVGHNDYLDYMKAFKYPLAGEFSFRRNLMADMRIPCDWGIEIGILSEMYRNQASNRICQVDLADTYDHKHQDLSIDDQTKGLSKMSIDIIKTLIKKLATQGNSFSLETFRSIKATYYRTALDMIDIYRSDALMNGLKYDSHMEEKAVELFALNIMKAGESFFENPMDTPFIPTWSRVNSAIPNFMNRLKQKVELDNEKYKS
ncbi:MAG: glycosyl transferase [Alphaproteobacteria bacterium]|jgi:glucosyl-3-phosphoglycerate synthase|nr:MAG: glycosyl transferase [Alphaproteobacteria bacterium]|tara:strand:- start:38 stop:1261 length:1224 start_codon:yes stop_codon:yes gene_type:complete